MEANVIVIGAGISGLSAALALKKRGADVLVLEANPFAGGVIRTVLHEGYLCEYGPNTIMLSKPSACDFLKEINMLDSAQDAAPDSRKRFVVQNGSLVPIASSPIALCAGKLLSWKTKLKILQEPFVPRGKDTNETVADFVRRRLGEEVLRELVDPFISGIYAGDPERLLLRYTFPSLHHLEQVHGSLLLGILKTKQSTASKRRLLSWSKGLSGLISGMTTHLQNRIRFSTAARLLTKQGSKFTVDTDSGSFKADQVIMAADAMNTARLLAPLFPNIKPLEKMSYAPMCVLHLGFPRASVGHPLDGFGFLISRNRSIRTLGALFSSTLFPNRAPEGHVLLTVFVGGALDPQAISLDDSTLIQTVLRDLQPLLQIKNPPRFHHIIRWKHAIPQYEADYPSVLETCQAIESAHPGLHLIGNYRGGISLEDCLSNGQTIIPRFAE